MQTRFQNMLLNRPLTEEDIDLLERVQLAGARENFYAYRKLINPDMIEGWYQKEVAQHLEQFYWDWRDGLRPVLVLEAPPQHGKSRQVTEFLSWIVGHDPDLKAIYASYSDDLGKTANTTLQRIMMDSVYQRVFPATKLNTGYGTMGGAARNSTFLEFVNYTGSFRNTTVEGQITGKGLDIGVIDDPIKGREEASSETIREKTWQWFTDDFFSRFSDRAGLLMIMTRWHLDDPVGRFLERYPDAKQLKYPALGRHEDGKWIADDVNGEPLFPELKSMDFLQKRKEVLGIGSWTSLYQQSPIVVGGDLFPVEKFEIIKAMPTSDKIKRTVRYWDKAGTKDGGAMTAGVLMHELINRKFVVEHVVRGQWSALDRERRIRQTCEMDNAERRIETWVEQEPGSGGKESAENTIMSLRGYKVYADPVRTGKENRAEPYGAQVQAGNVALLQAPWNRAFIDEHETFPNGKFKDQVDAAAAAFLKLTVRKSSYDPTLSWVTGAPNDD